MKNLCVLCGLILGLLTACGDLFGPEDAPHALWVGETGLVLEPGETVRLSAKAMETRNSLVEAPRGASWSTDDTSVVELRKNGEVRAVAPGRATVWVNAGTKRDSATVIVREVGAEPRTRWLTVDVGEETVCALNENHRAYCWGSDYYGQIGDGVRRKWTITMAPKPVGGGHRFLEIASGMMHVCARKPNDRILCWGENQGGATGSGSEHPRMLLKPSAIDLIDSFRQVRAGQSHTVAISSDGRALAWGSNQFAQIGDGTGGISESRFRPTPVQGNLLFAHLAPAAYHTCGITLEGAAYCWGNNQSGALGTGGLDEPFHSSPVPVASELKFEELSAGGSNTCGLTSNGSLYCWGSNASAFIDPNGDRFLSRPTPMLNMPRFKFVSVGFGVICGISSGNHTYCLGRNSDGQLGSDSEDHCELEQGLYCAQPLPVAGNHQFTQVSTNGGATCGVTDSRALYCWGANQFGWLGIGSLVENSPVPLRVADPL